ncbi:MAG: zinc ribbon domain-containing protein [Actinomycetota bacterium]
MARVPIEEGFFRISDDPGGPPRRLGSRCPACGEVFFPRRLVCAQCLHEGTSDLARRLPDDIDVDCGPVLTGDATTAEIGERILHAIVAVASGRPTCSERLGYGLDEFVPWTDGITL